MLIKQLLAGLLRRSVIKEVQEKVPSIRSRSLIIFSKHLISLLSSYSCSYFRFCHIRRSLFFSSMIYFSVSGLGISLQIRIVVSGTTVRSINEIFCTAISISYSVVLKWALLILAHPAFAWLLKWYQSMFAKIETIFASALVSRLSVFKTSLTAQPSDG